MVAREGHAVGVESPCSLLPDGERKQHLDFLSPAGLESLVGRGVFSALQCPLAEGQVMGWELRGDGSPAHHHKALHWGVGGGFSCALLTFAAAEGRPGFLWRGGGSPQPPDHCDTRAGICRHRGD